MRRLPAPNFSRRSFLAVLPASKQILAAGRGRVVPSVAKGYKDPSTEFGVLRLTDPAYTSLLPAPSMRTIVRRGGSLVFSSDSSGNMEAYRIDLKSGESRQLTEAGGLDPSSVTIAPDERGIFYMDKASLMSAPFSGLKTREVYRVPGGWEPVAGLGASEDALYATLIEKNGSRHRLRLIRMADGSATTLAEAEEEMRESAPRPKRASVLYRRGGGFWLANFDAQQNYRLKLAEGEISQALWSPDGRGVLYLNVPPDRKKLIQIREFTPDLNEDKTIAETSQFASFGRNADATMFVGASGSKASPFVLLLARAVKREITVCEHRASDPRMVSPFFSPNSQRIFFNSDQHGKPAIYSMLVERLVSDTEDKEAPYK